MKPTELIDRIMEQEKAVRYVAILSTGQLFSKARPGISGGSSSESDKYEELLVNPTLLKLTTQRGAIDCGGLNYILVRYGNFFQWISPLVDGHISVCIDSKSEPLSIITRLLLLTGAQHP